MKVNEFNRIFLNIVCAATALAGATQTFAASGGRPTRTAAPHPPAVKPHPEPQPVCVANLVARTMNQESLAERLAQKELPYCVLLELYTNASGVPTIKDFTSTAELNAKKPKYHCVVVSQYKPNTLNTSDVYLASIQPPDHNAGPLFPNENVSRAIVTKYRGHSGFLVRASDDYWNELDNETTSTDFFVRRVDKSKADNVIIKSETRVRLQGSLLAFIVVKGGHYGDTGVAGEPLQSGYCYPLPN